MHHYLISDFSAGDRVEGYYIIHRVENRKTAQGKPFLSAVIVDASGSVNAVFWDYAPGVDSRDNGKVVFLSASVGEYNGTPQLRLNSLRLAEKDENFSPEKLVATAPLDVERAMADVDALVATIEDEDYRRLCETMLQRHRDTFMSIPAAKSVHHAFLHGLLMHTVNMLQTADFLAAQYSYAINRSLLLAGTLLHDFAKAAEFDFSPMGLAVDYSVRGELLGHLYMGACAVDRMARELGLPAEKSMLLQHMLLSHHGQPEFGAAVVPKCAESELLSLIDMVDSRMEIYAETMEKNAPGTFSERIFALEKRVYCHE